MKVCQATSGGREDEKAQGEEKKLLLQNFSKPVGTVLCEM